MEQLALFEEQERTEHESFIAFEDWLAHLAFADLPAKEKVKRLQEAIVGRRSARKVLKVALNKHKRINDGRLLHNNRFVRTNRHL